jgi:cell division protein FtsI/penicillin-binding protein 2
MSSRAASFSVRRRRLARRGLPVAALAGVSFAVGIVVGAGHVSGEQRVVERLADAWGKQDYAGIWAVLTPEAQHRYDAAAVGRAYRSAADTATVRSMTIGHPRRDGDAYLLPVTVQTVAFATVRGTVRLPLVGEGDAARVDWAPYLTFPGVPRGERVQRITELPRRAALLARDGTVLARGPDRSSPLGDVARAVVGELGAPPPDRAGALYARGYPADATVGVSGLERIYETRLAGRPGGQLIAGGRVLASTRPQPAPPVRTSIDPQVQRAAVTALAGRLGGVLALRPRSGEILAVAGIPFSGLQPPGSTFKLVTVTAVLERGIAKPGTTFPYATSANLAGVELANANGESCGGTLAQAFATSCNSVFAPLGAKLGATRLVAAARKYGFDEPAPIPGAATSTVPPADQIGDDLAVGASAIGQGRVQATVLQMTSIAATIALGGTRPVLRLSVGGGAAKRGPRVTTARVARQIRRMMVGVVTGGTGRNAAISGVPVAGKTGTAELRTTVPCKPDPAVPENPESCPESGLANDPTDTDAWFVGFAPARSPRIVVGVLLVRSGAGGDTAAPAARQVMIAGLQRAED